MTNTVSIEIDGKKILAKEGATLIDAARDAGISIPHFCYHKKLSVAANCRMCLVEVEKMPKPVPACATRVADGMKVFLHSELVLGAQKAILEFLLINHPLDCPVCDQGGECRLQDLSMRYGGTRSRTREAKRVVSPKDIGPLVSMREMSRCIHCTRCVRFCREIAGLAELGVVGRGGDSEIAAFAGRSVDSELSGNLIDVCPVGALTSKPFRFRARAWELCRRPSISPHDSFGTNVALDVKDERVVRVLPRENEEINECWLSDRDRFSYEGLNSPDRLKKPLIRIDGALREVEWNSALDYAAHALKSLVEAHGADALASLASPSATLEEIHLLQKLTRALGSGNVDFRPRRRDFSTDGHRSGIPWLGMRIAEIAELDAALVVGSFPRKDNPLFALRLRQLAKKAGRVSMLSLADDDPRIDLAARVAVRPSELPAALEAILRAFARSHGEKEPGSRVLSDTTAPYAETDAIRAIAESFAGAKKSAIFLGAGAEHSPTAGRIHAIAGAFARASGARLGFIGDAANGVGGYVAGALPTGLNAYEMFAQPRKVYLLHGVEPELDCHNPAQSLFALRHADLVVAVTPFVGETTLEYADVVLPAAPFSETSGSFVNTEGRVQSFEGACRPLGESRPAWKIFCALGRLLGLPGFDYASSAAVRDEILVSTAFEGREGVGEIGRVGRVGWVEGLDNALDEAFAPREAHPAAAGALERVSDVPIHFSDAIVRRAAALRETKDAAAPEARMHPTTLEDLKISDGERVRIRQASGSSGAFGASGASGETTLTARSDTSLPEGCVRVAAAHPSTAALGDMFGTLTVERA
ncbi:MAG: NADH-quinone oxidoreductase subunit NuoG [Candidatus Accumulibacter sp.]|jgi:NADH-quinone oxidoreductase subunit G|nr:NADH-quinone oxidoreductase subunit NuoG [Accumulibacter sp.]